MTPKDKPVPKPTAHKWDVDSIFMILGGPSTVSGLLSEMPDPPDVSAVRAWQKRQSIPSSWLAQLLPILRRQHGRLAEDFLIRAKVSQTDDTELDALF